MCPYDTDHAPTFPPLSQNCQTDRQTDVPTRGYFLCFFVVICTQQEGFITYTKREQKE